MSLTDDLYREIILEHFREPRNYGRLDPADLNAQGTNPFCGDELEVTGRLQGSVLTELMSQGKGCSISQASASLMTEALKAKPIAEVVQLAKTFKEFLLGSDGAPVILPAALEELDVLGGVKKYPVRIKCALLAWNTLLEALESATPSAPASPTPTATAPAPTDPAQKHTVLREALKTVIDPEINMNIVDLGLVYSIDVNAQDQVRVTYTLTSPGCPLGPVIVAQVQGAVRKLPWVTQVQCDLVWSPPWDPKTMASEEAKMELGIW